MRVFASLFGKSPFGPMQEHMKKAASCARLVRPFFEALAAGRHERVEEIRNRIFRAEEEADYVKNEVRNHLPKSLFMPIDRRDLLEVLDMQDSVADVAQDIVELLELRPMELPEELQDDLFEMVDTSIAAVEQALEISEKLDDLVAASFSGPDADRVFAMISKLSEIEHENDQVGMRFIRHLFAIEDELKPVDVMFWYQIAGLIGDLADYSQKMGNRLRLLIAKA